MEVLNNLKEYIGLSDFNDKIAELFPEDKFETEVDLHGNVVAKTKSADTAKKRIMICTLAESRGIFIKSIKDNKAQFDIIGRLSKESLTDSEIFNNGESVGIIRSVIKDGKIDSQSLELWDNNSVKTGDFCILNPKATCKGDKLYGFGVDRIICVKTALFIATKVDMSVNGIYFTVSTSEKAAISAAERIQPDYIYLVSAAEETDSFKSGSGCGIVFKDGCAVVTPKIRNHLTSSAVRADVKFSAYADKFSLLPEKLGISGDAPEVGAIYIPVSNLNSTAPIINLNDVCGAEKTLLEALRSR